MTVTTTKDVQKLQRIIVDALEDVKAQNLVVFNTEHLSPLFERVIIATGTSNRQTKSLASSVKDKVREAGWSKPRVEGEDNGEWIIVDCGAAVVHIMQLAIRQYYNLEELWGDKPVRLKLGSPQPVKLVKAEPVPKKNPLKATKSTKVPAKKAVASKSSKPDKSHADQPSKARKTAAKTTRSKPAKSAV